MYFWIIIYLYPIKKINMRVCLLNFSESKHKRVNYLIFQCFILSDGENFKSLRVKTKIKSPTIMLNPKQKWIEPN